MKFFKFVLALTTLATPFFGSPVLAATYPATCPAEAQGIVEAVGGCAAISPTDYSAIYGKCCAVEGAPHQPEPSCCPSPEPTPTYDEESAPITLAGVVILVGLLSGAFVGIRALMRSRKKGVGK